MEADADLSLKLLDLNIDVQINILQYLEMSSLAKMAQVCTHLRDLIYSQKQVWANIIAALEYRDLKVEVALNMKQRGIRALIINSHDECEDLDTDLELLKSAIDNCSKVIDPKVLIISQMRISLENTVFVFAAQFQSLKCLVLHNDFEDDNGFCPEVTEEGLLSIFKAMPHLQQLHMYIRDSFTEQVDVFQIACRWLPALKDLELIYIKVGDPFLDVNFPCDNLERLAMVLPSDKIMANYLGGSLKVIDSEPDPLYTSLEFQDSTLLCKNFKNLKHLELTVWQCDIGQTSRHSLLFEALETLRVTESGLGNFSLLVEHFLKRAPKLRALDVSVPTFQELEYTFFPNEMTPFKENDFLLLAKQCPNLVVLDMSGLLKLLPYMMITIVKHLANLQVLKLQCCWLDMVEFSQEEKTTFYSAISRRQNSKAGLFSILGIDYMEMDGEYILSTPLRYIMGFDGVIKKRMSLKDDSWCRVRPGSHDWHKALGSRTFHLESSWTTLSLIQQNTPSSCVPSTIRFPPS